MNTYKLTDSHRLYLFVTPGGGKLRKWGYGFAGRQKTLSLGAYPREGSPRAAGRPS